MEATGAIPAAPMRWAPKAMRAIGSSTEEVFMRKRMFKWLGREFISLSAEGEVGLGAAEEARVLLDRFDEELRSIGNENRI